MRAKIARAILCGLLPCVAAAETATPEAELRLPENDILWKAVKDKKFVYAITLAWPGEAFRSRMVKPKAGSAVRLLGHDRDLAWRMDGDTLVIDLPPDLQGSPARPAYAFKVESEPWETFASALPADVPPAAGAGKAGK